MGELSLSAAIVGCGAQGALHALDYQRENVPIAFLYDIDPQKALALHHLRSASGNPHLSVVADYHDATVVSICSYDSVHYAQVLRAVCHNQHTLVEKPMCRTQNELALIFQAWSHHERPALWCNFPLRHHPLIRAHHQILAEGKLGEVYCGNLIYNYGKFQKITAPSAWRSHEVDYSCMLGGGIHLVDLLFTFGFGRPVRVHGSGNTLATRATPFRYQSYQEAVFQYPSGLTMGVVVDFANSEPHNHAIEIMGTEDFLWFDSSLFEVELRSLVPDFVRAIRTQQPTAVEAQRVFDVHAAAIAAARACETNSTLDIEYLDIAEER